MEKFNQSTIKNSNAESEKKLNLPTWLKTAIISLGIIASQPVFSQINEGGYVQDKSELLKEMSDFYQEKLKESNEAKDSINAILKNNPELNKETFEYSNKLKENTVAFNEILLNPDKFYSAIVKNIEDQKEEIKKHFSSDDFLQKLKQNLSEQEALNKQSEILNNLDSVKVVIVSPSLIKEIAGSDAEAGYSPLTHSIYVSFFYFFEKPNNKEAIIHELFHSAYRKDIALSTEEKKILLENFTKKTLRNKESLKSYPRKDNKDYIEYLHSSAERIIRKKILDSDMEKLGIKKYSEKFTEEHYKKLKEFYDKNKLSDGSMELFDTCTFEQLQRIINTIAFEDAENLSKVKNIS